MFVSDQTFEGNFGVETADIYCEAEGKKLVPDRSWRALLASSSQTVRERVSIKFPVFNVFGSMVSFATEQLSVENAFWQDSHNHAFNMTQTGKDTHLFEEIEGKLQVIESAWSGIVNEMVFAFTATTPNLTDAGRLVVRNNVKNAVELISEDFDESENNSAGLINFFTKIVETLKVGNEEEEIGKIKVDQLIENMNSPKYKNLIEELLNSFASP